MKKEIFHICLFQLEEAADKKHSHSIIFTAEAMVEDMAEAMEEDMEGEAADMVTDTGIQLQLQFHGYTYSYSYSLVTV